MKINIIEKKLRKIVYGRSEGFSTFELVMVIAIAGIMAAVALPRLGAINTIDLDSVARQVKSDIRHTQEMAMSKYRETTITFTSNGSTYTITSAGSNESKELPEFSRAIFSPVGTGTTDLIYTFNSTGEPVTGAGGILRITSEGAFKNIIVENTTGRAAIQ
ncbi:type II secretory system protein [Candidatus Scalindua japonica]|uniref:Type II secretory system protein n=1 Tax=Candidatus Scalindua japonica TaxID=1284222 RepID=A0A286TYX1_9BACT|nr:type II secretion system protein [Candidatus Scalindua japonica]GAX61085.1 type II secretory system protein [Candidatus Scalindua japonica]